MNHKAAIIFAHKSRQVEIIIKFYAAKDPSLTGLTFAPTRAEALVVKAHLEGRGYVVDLPTRRQGPQPGHSQLADPARFKLVCRNRGPAASTAAAPSGQISVFSDSTSPSSILRLR